MKPLLKSPVSYYGGKGLMVKTLLPLIPNHKTYCEPFVGGGSLFFAKQPSKIEVINDINGFVVAFYRVIKHRFDELNALIQDTMHDEYTYNRCREVYRRRIESDDLMKAYSFWVGANMSFGGSIYDGSFQITTNTSDRCNPATNLKEKRARFLTIANRLEKTMILQKDAIEVIKKYDNPDIFHYCDPPYVGANQGHYKGYTIEDFKALLDMASVSKSKVMISCYWHDIIDDYDFIVNTKKMKTRVVVTDKVEVILRNYKSENSLFSM